MFVRLLALQLMLEFGLVLVLGTCKPKLDPSVYIRERERLLLTYGTVVLSVIEAPSLNQREAVRQSFGQAGCFIQS